MSSPAPQTFSSPPPPLPSRSSRPSPLNYSPTAASSLPKASMKLLCSPSPQPRTFLPERVSSFTPRPVILYRDTKPYNAPGPGLVDVVDGDRVGEGKAALGLSLHLDSETVNLDHFPKKECTKELEDEFDCIRKAVERKQILRRMERGGPQKVIFVIGALKRQQLAEMILVLFPMKQVYLSSLARLINALKRPSRPSSIVYRHCLPPPKSK